MGNLYALFRDLPSLIGLQENVLTSRCQRLTSILACQEALDGAANRNNRSDWYANIRYDEDPDLKSCNRATEIHG